MLKIIGIVLIVGTTTLFGYQVSQSFIKRVKEIRQMILAIQIIETEMSYSQLNLQTIFQHVAEKIEAPASMFYQNMALVLSESIQDFSLIWEQQLELFVKRSELKKSDIEIIKQFGRTLGSHTFIQQQKHILLTIKYLEKQQEEAMELQYKYEKMSKSLGILGGLVIVILFF